MCTVSVIASVLMYNDSESSKILEPFFLQLAQPFQNENAFDIYTNIYRHTEDCSTLYLLICFCFVDRKDVHVLYLYAQFVYVFESAE